MCPEELTQPQEQQRQRELSQDNKRKPANSLRVLAMWEQVILRSEIRTAQEFWECLTVPENHGRPI